MIIIVMLKKIRLINIKEKKVIIITALLNLLVASIKLFSGLIFSFSTLIADSIQSFIDFFTDIASLIANKIGKRRANKTYPFGYGQVYYLSNLLTGLLLFLIGIFIVVHTFINNKEFVPSINILIILIIVLLLKLLVLIILQKYNKSSKNELLIESYKESKADLISTCVVIIVLLLSFINIPFNIDKIGSISMAIYVFYISIKMIISNIRGILINDKENDELKEEIKKELEHYKDLHINKIKVIKISYYYAIFLQIDINNNVKIKDFIRIEKKIKNKLKSINKLIKFVDIEPM